METLASIIESILFVSGDAVAVKDISEKLCLTDKELLQRFRRCFYLFRIATFC